MDVPGALAANAYIQGRNAQIEYRTLLVEACEGIPLNKEEFCHNEQIGFHFLFRSPGSLFGCFVRRTTEGRPKSSPFEKSIPKVNATSSCIQSENLPLRLCLPYLSFLFCSVFSALLLFFLILNDTVLKVNATLLPLLHLLWEFTIFLRFLSNKADL